LKLELEQAHINCGIKARALQPTSIPEAAAEAFAEVVGTVCAPFSDLRPMNGRRRHRHCCSFLMWLKKKGERLGVRPGRQIDVEEN